ncbi:MAG: component of SufBCD complex [Paracoccaceae bacterium]
MKWYETVYELIDMRSFSNLWFWIGLAVLWSTASHWVLGIPYDMVIRARRHRGQAEEDVQTLARINVNRLLYIGRVSGLWLAGIAAFMLTGLILLGFVYRQEFAQAVFCLFFPMTLVGMLSLYTAQKIEAGENVGDPLYRRLTHHRMAVQAIGMVSILLTSLWGMWQNMTISPL